MGEKETNVRERERESVRDRKEIFVRIIRARGIIFED